MSEGAPYGNKHAAKKMTPEQRQKAYHNFCDHLAEGYSIASWHFDEDGVKLSYKTMLTYMKDEDEFPPIHKEIADAKSLKHWEKIVYDSARGINKEANTASLQMVMRNKFAWDKYTDRQPSDIGEIGKTVNSLLEQITNTQRIGFTTVEINTNRDDQAF